MKISIAEKSFLKIETDKFVVYYNFSRECKKIPQCNVFYRPICISMRHNTNNN